MIVIWRRFKHHRLGVIALFVLSILVLLALFASILQSFLGVSHSEARLININMQPSWPHLLGTNELGQDIFTRLIYGGRISLSVAFLAALSSALVGTFIGLVAGYYGGFIDALLMRFTDAMLCVPVLPLMIVFAALDLGALAEGNLASVTKLIVIIVFFGWMSVARLARASVLQLKNLEFVAAARSLGASDIRIMMSHILPNALAPIIIAATLEVGTNILYEAALSFLGLGIQPPASSWGTMLNNAVDYVKTSPSLAFWPGFFILITVSCFNFLGDGMRDALDPHQVLKNVK